MFWGRFCSKFVDNLTLLLLSVTFYAIFIILTQKSSSPDVENCYLYAACDVMTLTCAPNHHRLCINHTLVKEIYYVIEFSIGVFSRQLLVVLQLLTS